MRTPRRLAGIVIVALGLYGVVWGVLHRNDPLTFGSHGRWYGPSRSYIPMHRPTLAFIGGIGLIIVGWPLATGRKN